MITFIQRLIRRHQSKWKQQYMFPNNVVVGQNCRILGLPMVLATADASISLGDRVVLNSEPYGYHAGMGFPVTLIADRSQASITIAADSRLHGCCVHAWSQITIGRKCLFAAGSQVLDAHGHATQLEFAKIRSSLRDEPQPIGIGNHCWIGIGALILKGVTLGDGCIVGAYSVVTAGSYPPYSLIIGNPRKVIKTISPDDVLPEDYPLEILELGGMRLLEYT